MIVSQIFMSENQCYLKILVESVQVLESLNLYSAGFKDAPKCAFGFKISRMDNFQVLHFVIVLLHFLLEFVL